VGNEVEARRVPSYECFYEPKAVEDVLSTYPFIKENPGGTEESVVKVEHAERRPGHDQELVLVFVVAEDAVALLALLVYRSSPLLVFEIPRLAHLALLPDRLVESLRSLLSCIRISVSLSLNRASCLRE
jgi:hypothetical protein